MVSRWIIRSMRNFFRQKFVEKIKIRVQQSPHPEIHAVFVVQHGTARPATDDNIIRRMRIACWITEATDTHSEYVIIAFPRQHCLRERASLLRYAYIAWLVIVEVCYCWSGLCCELGTAEGDLVILKRGEADWETCSTWLLSNCST